MNEKEYIDKVVETLEKVPEKHLLIIELVNKVGMKGKELDYDKLKLIQPEVNLACAEAKTYGGFTIQAVDALIRVKAREAEEIERPNEPEGSALRGI